MPISIMRLRQLRGDWGLVSLGPTVLRVDLGRFRFRNDVSVGMEQSARRPNFFPAAIFWRANFLKKGPVTYHSVVVRRNAEVESSKTGIWKSRQASFDTILSHVTCRVYLRHTATQV
jgi:hypothetical protein